MKGFRALSLLGMCLSSTPQHVVVGPVLQLDVAEAILKIQPREPGRKEIRVPDLDLAIIARFRCPIAGMAESVTISIADTLQHYAPDQLDDKSRISVTFSVPGDQVAPVAATDFCTADRLTTSELRIPGIATAHGSLRCRGESGLAVYYASTALPLRLLCDTQGFDDTLEDNFEKNPEGNPEDGQEVAPAPR